MRAHTHWRWRLDEVYVKINGKMRYLWRAVDHEGEVLESYVTEHRDKAAALKFIKKALKRHGRPKAIVTDGLRSYGAALKEIGAAGRRETGRWLNNRVENSHLPLRRRERAMSRFRRDEDPPEIQLGPRLPPQPFQPGTPPRQPRNPQAETLRRPGRVARSPGLNACLVGVHRAQLKTSRRWTDTSPGARRKVGFQGARPHRRKGDLRQEPTPASVREADVG